MAAAMRTLLLLLPWVLAIATSSSSSPTLLSGGALRCSLVGRSFNCSITNAYGSFNDRIPCHAGKAVYPRTEAELVGAVAMAVKEKRKAKVGTVHFHGFPKLACPGGDDGTIISTARLNRVVRVDVARRQMTVESGMLLRDLIQEAGAAGLSLPNSPYFDGLTVGGMLATGAHGSSLTGKGGAVHEYVVGMRVVTPAPSGSERLAVVRELGADDPDLNAAKVSLGVLGVISQVTLQLESVFKRNVTFLTKDSDAELPEMVAVWGRQHEFGDIMWLPGQGKVVLRKDDRVDISASGDGLNQGLLQRVAEEQLLEEGSNDALCRVSRVLPAAFEQQGFGFTNDGESFTGYPVVGYQHRIQASGAWNSRTNDATVYSSGLSVPLSKAKAFIKDVLSLRDLHPDTFCGLDMHLGILFRYVKASTAYLGKTEDSVDLDIAYYRSHVDGSAPAMHADVVDELEQIALYKYGAQPHWGKNRNYAFNDTAGRYPMLREFLDVKARFDPDGVFSSEWSDQVLGINGSPVRSEPRCAVEGLCTCTQNSDCAPGYVCRSGKVYPEARVCSVSQPQGVVAQL